MTNPSLLGPAEAAGEGPVLVVGPPAARLWRELGALAWATLTELALTAGDDGGGWVAPVGAREVAARLGINKDTAARALAALAGAGLLRRERVDIEGVGRRSAYRLVLPAGLALCPAVPDDAAGPTQRDRDRCPQPASSCPASSDGTELRDEPAPSAAACPSPPDAGTPRSPAGVERGDPRGDDGGATARGDAADAPAVAVARFGVDLFGEAPISEGVRCAGAPARCRRSVARAAAQGGAQGQLFDMPGTAGSEDQPR